MKLSFLCTNHRKRLSSRPDEAIHCCANSCETGWNLYRQQRLEEALPYMGCAFELANILFAATNREITPVQALEWFLYTLAGFTQTLKKLGKFGDCKDVYQSAITQLQTQSTSDATLEKHIALQVSCLRYELTCLGYDNQFKVEQANSAQQYPWSTAVH